MLQGDVELAIAHTVTIGAEDVDRAGVLADLGAAEWVTIGQDRLDGSDLLSWGTSDGLFVIVSLDSQVSP